MSGKWGGRREDGDGVGEEDDEYWRECGRGSGEVDSDGVGRCEVDPCHWDNF